MRILTYGSINIDHVYAVAHFVRPGESLPATSYAMFAGGKGLNQSLALARAGAHVWHAGKVGAETGWVLSLLREAGVDTSHVAVGTGPTGHAMIQVNPAGENCIVVFGGANQCITAAEIDRALAEFGPGDFLLVQNEINELPSLMRMAKARGMQVVFNPAPMTPAVASYPNELVDYLILNEIEAAELTGQQTPDDMLSVLGQRLPATAIVLTLGEHGSIYCGRGERLSVPALPVCAIDTTAAGDTFIGYLLAELAQGAGIQSALALATQAAAICVTRAGAAASIPWRSEVLEQQKQRVVRMTP